MTGNDLRTWRKSLRYSQAEMAEQLHISRRKYQQAEYAENTEIGPVMNLIVRGLRCAIEHEHAA